MKATLTITQKRISLKTEWFKGSKEQKDYIFNTYKDLGAFFSDSTSYYEKKITRTGEYDRILDFLSEINNPGTLLHDRFHYNKKNNISETFEVDYEISS